MATVPSEVVVLGELGLTPVGSGPEVPLNMATNIVINPESDAAFKGLAETHLALGATTPAELESRLRPRYPTVRVIEGISSAASIERWYVYRDGRWVNSEPSR